MGKLLKFMKGNTLSGFGNDIVSPYTTNEPNALVSFWKLKFSLAHSSSVSHFVMNISSLPHKVQWIEPVHPSNAIPLGIVTEEARTFGFSTNSANYHETKR